MTYGMLALKVECLLCSPLDVQHASLALRFISRRQVLLDVLALEQERARLHTTNAAMRAKLSGVLRGATISPDAVDRPRNGLLHVKSW